MPPSTHTWEWSRPGVMIWSHLPLLAGHAMAWHLCNIATSLPPGPFNNSPVSLSTSPSTSPLSICPLPHSSFSHPVQSSHTNPSVCPPSYSMHTVQPISSFKLTMPYTSIIIPLSTYLSDLSMPTLTTHAETFCPSLRPTSQHCP
jgi:hypothetical protein